MVECITNNAYPNFMYRKFNYNNLCGSIDGIFKDINFKRLELVDALKLSIEKWEFISYLYEQEKQEYVQDSGINSCALCQKYYGVNRDFNHCTNCPILKDTHKRFCYTTPYHDYLYVDIDNTDAHIKFAQNEVKYLKSLLEKLQKGE